MDDKKEKKVEYFTDEMHKNLYVFQDSMSNTSAGKPIMNGVTIKPPKTNKVKVQ